MWFETSVASVLGENKGFVGCHAILNVAGCMHERDVWGRLLLKLCQLTSQVTGQKQVLSYLQVVNSGVLAAR